MGTVSTRQKRRRRGRGGWDWCITVALATGEKYYARPGRGPYLDWSFTRAPNGAPLTDFGDGLCGRLAAWATVQLALRRGMRPPAAALSMFATFARFVATDVDYALQRQQACTVAEAAAVAEAAWDRGRGA